MTRSARLLLALAALGGCKGDKDDSAGETGDAAWRPDVVCPGDAGCETNDGQLHAGAAAVVVTPPCFETWEDLDGNGEWDRGDEAWLDCGCDQLCEGDDGWPGADEGEGDGTFQAVWIAGFGTGRPARSVHDDLWARAVAFRTGDTTVALVALDLVGWFYDDALDVRAAVEAAGADVDHVIVHATHNHEGPDTMGQWGEYFGKKGTDDAYLAFVVEQAAQAVIQAVAALEPATLYLASADTAAPFGSKGTRNTVRDSRDPVIIEQNLHTARFAAADGSTIATVVNWGNHPEVLSSGNTELTSDFVHYVRQGIEEGVTYDSYSVPGVGGVAVYVNASVGGLMTPLGITVTDGEGVDHGESDFDKAEALGKVLAELALGSMAEATPAVDPRAAVKAAQLYIPMENVAFQAAMLIGVFDRPAYNYDPDATLDDENVPELLTEVDVVDLGPLSMLTVPGELAPELAIGGYDGSRVNTDEDEFIDAGNPNPPAVDQAPEAPYFLDRLGNEHNWIVGLGNDEIGYLIPSYDYKLDDSVPYLVEAEGDHYEETNSVGPQAVPRIEEMVVKLTSWENDD